jgi:hypothetical protein
MSFLNDISIYNAAADFRISTASTGKASLWTGLKNTANDLTLSDDTRLRALTALITSAELLQVAISFSYPSTTSPVNPIPSGTVIHNDTVGLQGGSSTERYHSTFAQQTAWDNKASLSDITFANILGAVASNAALVAAFSAKQNLLSGNGLVRLAGSTLTYDNSVYLTNITGISAGGELLGTYPNPTLLNSAVIGKVLTGFTTSNTAIVATDSIVVMAGKAQGQIDALSALAANSITALTGDVSATGPGSVAATISNNAVTFAKMQQIAQGFMGRSSVGTGTGESLTPTQATALLNTFSASLKGLVPSSIVADGTKVLYDDGTWAVPPASGSGSVTNVSGAGIASLFSLSITNPSTTPALAFALIAQSANRIFAGPTSGAAAAPTWRVLAVSDIPELPISQISGLQGELDSYLPDALANDMIFIGNVSDVAVNAIVTGDLTAAYVDNSGTNEAEFTIANEAVTYAKIQNVTSQTLLGRFALADGVVQQLTLNGTDFTINSSTGVIGLATPNSPILTTKGDILTHTGAAQVRLGIGANATFFMADTAATTGNKWVAMSGDATIAVSGALTIANSAVTLAKMANMATNSFIGRISASTGVPEILTATQATSLLNLFSSSAKGLVPVVTGPAVGDVTYFLNATGTWTVPAGGGGGSGTVSSGTQYQLAYYAANGTTVSGLTLITASRALVSDANGLPIASTVSTTQLQYLASATGTTGTTSTNLVFSTSPTLVTPTLGAALATSINGLTITSTTGTLTLDSGSTLATSGAFSTTLTATATTTLTLPTTGTLATLAGTETFTNKTLNGPKIGSTGGQGHFHIHSTNSVPTGLTNYITVFGDKSPNKKLGFFFELDAFESYFQFNATTASKTYTFPDATGTVALINASNYLSVPKSGAVSGGIIFEGGTSGTISFEAPLIAGTQSYIFPSAYPAASSGYYLTSTNTGTLSWNIITGGGDVTGPASSVDGNFAVFDSTTGKIIKESAGASLSAAGIAVFNTSLALGVGGTTTGQLIFRNSGANGFTTTIQASASASANANYTWPQAPGTVGQILATDGSGNLSWTAAGAGDMTLAGVQTVTGAKTFGAAGNVGKLILAGSTSGTTVLNSGAVAGSSVLTLPVATSTLAALGLAQTFSALQSYSAGVTVSGGVTTFSHPPTTSTPISISGAGSTTTPHISFTGTTINWMSFGTTGIAAPTLINAGRSAGTKVVIIQGSVAATLDSAIGGESLGMWLSSAQAIRFYTNASTTVRAAFDGDASNSNLTLTNATAVSIVAVTATTANVFNTIATTINMAGAATTLNINNNTLAQTINIGTTSTQASTYNFGTGATVSGLTKTINIGTAGVSGSTTAINIGSAVSGATNTIAIRGNLTLGGTLNLRAGTATAGTAPLVFTSGTNLTTPVNGTMEYNGTNLFFTRAGTVREGVLTQSAVTTEILVSDTSVTINIGGTTYKLLAKA